VVVVSNMMVLGLGYGISVGSSVGIRTIIVGSSVGAIETIEYALLVEIKGFDFTMDMYELVFEKLV
jgi:hypothetical protein